MFRPPMTPSLRAAAHPPAALSTRARTSVTPVPFSSQHSARLFSTPCAQTQNTKPLTALRRNFYRPHATPSQPFAGASRQLSGRSKKYKRIDESIQQSYLGRLLNRLFPWKRVFLILGVVGVLDWTFKTETWNSMQADARDWEEHSAFSHIARRSYEQVMQEYDGKILPASHPHSIMANRVLQLLTPHAPSYRADWKVHVIKADCQIFAFTTPGGQIFVFTGILPVCQDDDGLAFILSHEMAHVLARHAEKTVDDGPIKNAVRKYAPSWADWSEERARELEADSIGLMIMSKACFDPEAAVRFWKRVPGVHKLFLPGKLSGQVVTGPSHPEHLERIENIRGLMDEARKEYENSKCGVTDSHLLGFQKARNWLSW